MKIAVRIALVLAVLALLPACATAPKPNPAAGYSFIHREFDLHWAWSTKQVGQDLQVDGLLKNVRYPRVESLEVNVALLDKSRKTIARGTSFPVPQPIDVDDYRPFDVVLKNARISEGDLLQFVVNYVGSAATSSVSWTSSFTLNARTGQPVGVGRVPTQEW